MCVEAGMQGGTIALIAVLAVVGGAIIVGLVGKNMVM